MEGYLRVARAADFPAQGGAGEPAEILLRVLGRRILLRRLSDETVQALELACRHQNADLAEAPRRAGVITCPRHGWQYDLATGACLNEPWAALRRFAVHVDDSGGVWLSIAPLET